MRKNKPRRSDDFYKDKKDSRVRNNQNYPNTSNDDDKDSDDQISKYLDIFEKENPNKIDKNRVLLRTRLLFLLGLLVYFVVVTYVISNRLLMAFSLGVAILFLFVIAFKDNFPKLKYFFTFHIYKFSKIDPFEGLTFFQDKKDLSILFMTNQNDLLTSATSVFKIEIMAENVRPTMNHFIESMYIARIPYTYQIVQTPLIKHNIDNSIKKNRYLKSASIKSFKTEIYFAVFYKTQGTLTNTKILFLRSKLNKYKLIIDKAFKTNFHHFKIKLLKNKEGGDNKNELTNALRSFVAKDNTSLMKNEAFEASKKNSSNSFLKIFVCIFIIVYNSIILAFIEVSIIYIVISNIIILIFIIMLWWRSTLFGFTKSWLRKNDNVVLLNPFKKMEFFYFKRIPDSLFLYYDKSLLIDMKAFNLDQVFSKNYVYPDKLFRASIGTPLTFTAIMSPLGWESFNREGKKFLNERANWEILNKNVPFDADDWLKARKGMFRTLLLTTISSHKVVDSLKIEHIEELERDLRDRFEAWGEMFQIEFNGYYLRLLKKELLINAFTASILKNKFIGLLGTNLKYIIFQGKTLTYLTRVVVELEKGVEVRIASEFNTPLYLENFINIGDTINTEFLEREVPFGFLKEQLENLLIMGGQKEDKDLLSMKIAIELIKTKTPSIIFDFTGNWSKIINYFKDTKFQNDLLYFKYGSSLSLNLLNSEIPYDKNNVGYLNYFFDVFAFAFKKDENYISNLKSIILRNPEMDLSSLKLDLSEQANWDKSPITDSLIALFNDFSQRAASFVEGISSDDSKVGVVDFIDNNKTIILDFSALDALDFKIFFTFIIISKIIHFTKSSDDYVRKNIIVSDVDVFFNSKYFEKYGNFFYHKIAGFIEPLFDAGFGFIFSTDKISYLHPTLINFFNNYVTFKTTHRNDIAAIQNEMNLQELQGQGYYSKSRKGTYQIEYLKQMRYNEILVKRSDISQPFPVIIDVDTIKDVQPLLNKDIDEYMKNQGYDLKSTEQKLLSQTKKSLFEIDLDQYYYYKEEIMSLLDAVRIVEKGGAVYRTSLKDILVKLIAKKTEKMQTYTASKLNKIAEKILDVLIKHEYLEEAHSSIFEGTGDIRSSYIVGPQFKKAIDDLYEIETQKDVEVNITDFEERNSLNGRKSTQTYYIDGVDVAFYNANLSTEKAKFSNIKLLITELETKRIRNFEIWCEASLRFNIDDKLEYEFLIDHKKIQQIPDGEEAKHFLLQLAKENNGYLISNDSFREYRSTFNKDWINKRRLTYVINEERLFFEPELNLENEIEGKSRITEEKNITNLSDIMKETEFKSRLMKELTGHLLTKLLEFRKCLKEERSTEAVSICRDYIKGFLIKLYKRQFEHEMTEKITEDNLEEAIFFLTKDKSRIPFSENDLITLLEQSDLKNITESNIDDYLEKMYSLMTDFSIRIQAFLSEGTINYSPNNKDKKIIEIEENE